MTRPEEGDRVAVTIDGQDYGGTVRWTTPDDIVAIAWDRDIEGDTFIWLRYLEPHPIYDGGWLYAGSLAAFRPIPRAEWLEELAAEEEEPEAIPTPYGPRLPIDYAAIRRDIERTAREAERHHIHDQENDR